MSLGCAVTLKLTNLVASLSNAGLFPRPLHVAGNVCMIQRFFSLFSYEMILDCTQHDPEERPPFSDLRDKLVRIQIIKTLEFHELQ